jgi:hypothetical protein
MRIKAGKMNDWTKTVTVNSQDGYSKACVNYAMRWAELMENAIDEAIAQVIAERADDMSHEADIDGITGFQYGAAVSMLSDMWAYGDYLRMWHNKKYGYKGCGVVNPAVVAVEEG